jgi:hypothetical protein
MEMIFKKWTKRTRSESRKNRGIPAGCSSPTHRKRMSNILSYSWPGFSTYRTISILRKDTILTAGVRNDRYLVADRFVQTSIKAIMAVFLPK